MALSNEQLFDLIKDGNEDLKPILWERIKKLAYTLASQFYRSNRDLCRSRGLEEWDIKQLSYLAYASLFESYTTEKKYGYTTALGYALSRQLREALGKGADTLNRIASSLDEIIGDEEDGRSVADLIADEDSSAPFEQIEDSSERENISRALHEAIETLNDRERNIITAEYFHGKTQTDIAADIGVTPERVRQLRKGAFRQLKADRAIKKLADELGYNSYRAASNTLGSFKRTGISGVELVAIERADISMRLSYYDKREEAESLLLNGGTFEEYEKAVASLQLAE